MDRPLPVYATQRDASLDKIKNPGRTVNRAFARFPVVQGSATECNSLLLSITGEPPRAMSVGTSTPATGRQGRTGDSSRCCAITMRMRVWYVGRRGGKLPIGRRRTSIRPHSADAYSFTAVKCVKPQYPHRINEIRHEE